MQPYTDALERALGQIVGRAKGELQLLKDQADAAVAAANAKVAEAETKLIGIEARISDRLAALRDGTDGRDGADGKDGADGVPGRDGADGPPGRDGIDGANGRDGIDGAPGRDGADGRDGRDGVDVDMERVAAQITDQVQRAIEALPPPEKGERGESGRDCDMDTVLQRIADEVRAAVAALPPAEKGEPGRDGIDGKDGRNGHDVDEISVDQEGAELKIGFTVGDTRTIFRVELPAGPAGQDGRDGEKGERGEAGRDGALPIVVEWAEGVHYKGQVKTHLGGTWQARCDTAKEPPHEDWICLAAPGRDGKDGSDFNPRGLWAPADTYGRLDVVALNGSSFVALRDDPGTCPGDGWKLLVGQGKRGERGDRGEKGPRGERGLPAEPVVAIAIDDEGMLTLTNGDGTKVHCDLYPVLAKISAR